MLDSRVGWAHEITYGMRFYRTSAEHKDVIIIPLFLISYGKRVK